MKPPQVNMRRMPKFILCRYNFSAIVLLLLLLLLLLLSPFTAVVDAKRFSLKLPKTEADDYATCVVEIETKEIHPIIFEEFTNLLPTPEDCEEFCADYKHHIFKQDPDSNKFCFCGNDSSQDATCTCPDFIIDPYLQPAYGDIVCSGKIYVDSWADIQLALDNLAAFSTREDATLAVKDIGIAAEYEFNFGDGSDIATSNQQSAIHTYVQEGVYRASIRLTTGFGEGLIEFDVHILDSPRVSALTTPTFIDGTAGKPLSADVLVEQATEASVTWQRTNPDGSIIKGGFCQPSWHEFEAGCVHAVSSVVLVHSDAAQYCIDTYGGQLISITDSDELRELAAKLTLDSQLSYYIEHDPQDVTVSRVSSSLDCYVLSGTGDLDITPCDLENPFICQTGVSECAHGGHYDAATEMCYLATSNMQMTFVAAEAQCQKYGGHLVKLDGGDAQTAYLTSNVLSSLVSSAWIGLTDSLHEGSYVWTAGTSLSSATYAAEENKMAADCMLLVHNITTQPECWWEQRDCEEEHDFVCQYRPGDFVSVLSRVSVLGPLLPGPVSSNISPIEASPSVKPLITSYILPGAQFTKDGSLQTLHLQTPALVQDTTLRIQVYRAHCNDTYKIHPGCSYLPTPYTTCHTHPISSCAPGNPAHPALCPRGEQPCALAATPKCSSPSSPCLCNDGSEHTASAYCTAGNRPVTEQPTYTLVGHLVVTLPMSPSPSVHRVFYPGEEEGLAVRAFDILGFQFEGDVPPIKCEEDTSNSKWRQSVIVTESSNWKGVGYETDVTNSTWLDDHICHISAVYSFPESVALPFNLAHMPYAMEGVYTFSATVTNDVGVVVLEESVDILEEIKGFALIEPAMNNQEDYLLQEAGVTTFLFRIADGNYARLESQQMQMQRFHPSCPSSFGSSPTCATIAGHEQYSEAPLNLVATPADQNFTSITFIATNTAFNQTMDIDVLVQERISELNFVVESPPARVNTQTALAFKMATGSHMTFTWSETCDLSRGATEEMSLSKSFSQPGICQFTVGAENFINSKSVVFDVMICASTQASTIDIEIPKVVEINTEIDITALVSLSQFSCTLLVFEFGDSATPVLHYHEEKVGGSDIQIQMMHLFSQSGDSTITVTLLDSLDNSTLLTTTTTVTVNRKLQAVSIETVSNPQATGKEHEFTAHTVRVSGIVYYSFDMGDGSVITGTEATVKYSYNQMGTFEVRVTASNNISEVSNSISMQTLEPITNLHLEKIAPSLQGETLTITATITAGTEAKYQYFIDTVEEPVQDTGVLQYTCTNLGSYNISILVFNNVSKDYASFTLYVVDMQTLDILMFDNDACVERNVSATFTANMIHFDPSILNYNWEFGDGTTESGPGEVSVEHIYDTVTTYTLKVTASDEFGNETSIETEKCVQDRITGLTVNHNGPVALQHGHVVTVQLSAAVAMGTAIKYKWDFFQDGVSYETDTGAYEFEANAGKTYEVEVTAFNDVSSEQKRIEIQVVERISGVAIEKTGSVGFVAVGETQKFTAVILTGSHMQYTWTVDGTEVGTDFELQYLFSMTGQHIVTLTAENPVDTKNIDMTVIGQQPIRDAVLSSATPAGAPNQPITFSITISQGSDANYQWKLCDTCGTVQGTAQMTHTYSVSGQYLVIVTVSNLVSTVTTTKSVNIFLPITGLQITLSNIAASRYIPKNKLIEFNFEIDDNVVITDQEWQLIYQTRVAKTSNTRSFEHSFMNMGTYTAKLRAWNAMEEKTTTLEFEVLEEIKDVEIEYTGETNLSIADPAISLRTKVTEGSEVAYSWEVKSLATQSVTMSKEGDALDVDFTVQGDYTVTVVASNVFGSQMQSMNFAVYNPVGMVEMEVLSVQTYPFLPAFEAIEWKGNSDTSMDDRTEYIWTFQDTLPPSFYYTRFPLHTFNAAGDYLVHLLIRNPISTAETENQVQVQEKVKELLIKTPASAVIPGSVVNFEATSSQGSSLFYEWTVRDETNEIGFYNGSRVHYSHTFKSVGTYTVKVVARNKVSEELDLIIIKVEERIEKLRIVECCDYMYGLGYEVVLTATVEKGSNVEYNWTVLDELIIEYSGAQMKHEFLQAGVYTIGVTGHNALNSETLWIEVHIDIPITKVQIVSDNNLVLVNEGVFVNFTAVVFGGRPSENLVYGWFLNNDKLDGLDTQHITLNFTQGNKVLEVQVDNDVSSKRDSVSFTVYDAQCDSPVLTPSGGIRRTELKSRSVEFEMTVEACIWKVLNHNWKVYGGNCDDPIGEEVELPRNVTVTSPTLTIPARILDYGKHCVVFTSSFKMMPNSYSSEVRINLTILPSLLRPIIKGGSGRTMAKSERAILNGMESYDPDLPRNDNQDLDYRWECEAQRITSALLGETDSNCFRPTPGSVLIIPSDTFSPNYIYKITLQIFSTYRGASTTQQLTVSSLTTPSVIIECVSCRERNLYYISSSIHMKFVGECRNCGPFGAHYHWEVIRDDGKRLTLDGNSTRTGDNKPSLSIKQGVLSDGHSYTFSLNVTSDLTKTWGYAMVKLEAWEPPSDGQCDLILPVNGDVETLHDPVSVNCTGWRGHMGVLSLLTYHVFLRSVDSESSVWYPIYRGSNSHCTFRVAPFEDDLEMIEVVVEVLDKVGGKKTALVQTIAIIPLKSRPGMTVTQYLASIHEDQMALLLQKNNPKEIMQYSITLNLALNAEAGKDDDREEDAQLRREIRADLLLTLNETATLSAIDDLQQLAYTLQLSTTYSSEFPRDDDLYNIVSLLLHRITAAIAPQVSPGLTGQEFVPDYLMATVANLVQIVQFHMMGAGDVGGAEGEAASRMVESSLHAADDVMYLSLLTQVLDEDPIVFDTGYLQSFAQRVLGGGIKQTFSTPGVDVEFPTGLLSDLEESEVFQVFTVISSNPYSWGPQDSVINSHVLDTYFRHINGTYILMEGLDEQRHVSMGLGAEVDNPFNDNDGTNDGTNDGITRAKRSLWGQSSEDKASTIVEHYEGQLLNLLQYSSVFKDEESLNNSIESSQPKSRSKRDLAKTLDENVQEITLKPKETLSTKLNTSVVKGIIEGVAMIIEFEAKTLPWDNETLITAPKPTFSVYIGRDYVPNKYDFDQGVNFTNADDDRPREEEILFIANSNHLQDSDLYLTISNTMVQHSINVSVLVHFTVCQQYTSAPDSRWSPSSSCHAVPASTVQRARCQCSTQYRAMYGGSMLVAPGDLDFADLRDLNLKENPVVIITLCVLAIILLALMILARRWDLKDLRKISTVPMCGKDGRYKYEITVTTGRRKGAGTTANVGIKMYGADGKCPARHLSQQEAFQRSSVDTFLVATDTNLGQLQRIKIWHDNTGIDPDWYISKVEVRDLQTGKPWLFRAGCWLSLAVEEKKQASVEAELFPTVTDGVDSFWHTVGMETSQCFPDQHLWLSLWERPARSRFTRTQRVTCVAVLLYSYLAASAMWYGIMREPSEYEQVTGKSPMSWIDLAVGMAACVLALPLCIIAILLFKKSKTKPSELRATRKPGTAQTVEMEMEVASRETSAFGGHRTNVFHIPSDLERESTSDSISVHAGALHRCQPGMSRRAGAVAPGMPPFPRQESYLSDLTATACGEPIPDEIDPRTTNTRRIPGVVGEGGMWSYDTILHWPDEIPNFTDSSRQSSATAAFRPIYRQRTMSESEEQESRSRRASITSSRRGSLPRTGTIIASTAGTLPPSSGDIRTRAREAAKVRRRLSITDSAADQLLEEIDEIDEHCTQIELRSSQRSLSHPSSSRKTSTETMGSAQPRRLFGRRGSRDRDDGSGVASFERDSTGLSSKTSSSSNSRSKRSRSMSIDSWASWSGEGPSKPIPLAPAYSLADMEQQTSGGAGAGPVIWEEDNMPWLTAYGTIARHPYNSDPSSSLPPPSLCSNRPRLPWWCVIISYIYCAALIIFSAIVTLLYGAEFGRDVALRWLLASLTALLVSVCMLEPLKVVLSAALKALWHGSEKVGVDSEGDMVDIEPVLEANEKLKDVTIRPLGGYALLQAKQEGKKLWRMRCLLQQFVAYLLLICAVMVLNYASHDPQARHLNQYVKNTLIEADFADGTKSYTDIRDYSDYWQWLEEVLTPGLYLTTSEPHVTNSYMAGVARLRQIRSHQAPCIAESTFDRMNASYVVRQGCYGNPQWKEEIRDFCYGWKDAEDIDKTWVWNKTDSLPYHGETSTYSSNGYIHLLGQTQRQTKETIADLKAGDWIDRSTRAVFVEFVQYSSNSDLYSIVTLATEFPVSASSVPSYQVETLKLITLSGGLPAVYLIFEILLLILFIYLFINIIVTLYYQKRDFFTDLGNWIELVVTGLILGSFCMYCVMIKEHMTRYKEFLEDRTGFTNFGRALYWMSTWRSINAILLFLLMLMVVRQLRFIKCLSKYGETLSRAAPKILGVLLMCLLLLIAHAQAAYLYLGHMTFSFRTFGASLVSTVGTLRGDAISLDFTDYPRGVSVVCALLVVSASWLFLVAMFGLILGALTEQYRSVRRERQNAGRCGDVAVATLEPHDYQMIEFTMKRFKKWAGFTKPKPAFRRVKFEGLPTASECSSRPNTVSGGSSSRRSSDSSSLSLDSAICGRLGEEEAMVQEELLNQAWSNMWTKLLQVESLDKDENRLVEHLDRKTSGAADTQTPEKLFTIRKPPHPPLSQRRIRSFSESKLLAHGGVSGGIGGGAKGVGGAKGAGGGARPFSDQGQRAAGTKGLDCKEGWTA